MVENIQEERETIYVMQNKYNWLEVSWSSSFVFLFFWGNTLEFLAASLFFSYYLVENLIPEVILFASLVDEILRNNFDDANKTLKSPSK